MRERPNLIGKTYNFLKIVGDLPARRNKANLSVRYWKCECVCGKFLEVSTSDLIGKKPKKSCGCKSVVGFCNRKTTAKDSSIRALYNRYKQNAKRRKLFWGLSFENFQLMIFKDCVYCGTKPDNDYNVYITKEGSYRAGNKEWSNSGWIKFNGIDRRNNKIGYEEGNCVPCCYFCNRAKLNATEEEFLSWIKRVGEKYNERN